MPRPVAPAALSVAVLAFAMPALAGDMPNAADLSSQQQSRAISIRNLSGAKITQAHVQTSPDGPCGTSATAPSKPTRPRR
jgi:hypothetical protein